MTTAIANIDPDALAYLQRLRHALSCGKPECPCALGVQLHCPAHHHAHIPNLTLEGSPNNPTFNCARGCSDETVLRALSLRMLVPPYRIPDAADAGLDSLASITPQPCDWLWPGLIPFRALTLISGFPGSGKTAIALDIAARASVGSPAPGNPCLNITRVPVLIAALANPSLAPFIHHLESLGADANFIYPAQLLHHVADRDNYARYDDKDYDYEEEDDSDSQDPIPHPALRSLWTSPLPPLPKPPPAPREPTLQHILKRLEDQARDTDAGLIIIDQLEHLARPYGVSPARALAKLNLLAQRLGAAVLVLCNNHAESIPKAAVAARAYAPIPKTILATACLSPGARLLIPVTPTPASHQPIPYQIPQPTPGALAPPSHNQSDPSQVREPALLWSTPIPASSLPALAKLTGDSAPTLDNACRFLDSMLANGPGPPMKSSKPPPTAASPLPLSTGPIAPVRSAPNEQPPLTKAATINAAPGASLKPPSGHPPPPQGEGGAR